MALPVSCYLGSGRNALVDDVVSAALAEHPFEHAKIMGINYAVNCQAYSTIGRFNGQQPDRQASGLAHSSAVGMRNHEEHGIPFFSENVQGGTGFNNRMGAVCTRISALCFGGKTVDYHTITHHSKAPLIVDDPLAQGERYLASVTCQGANRPMQRLCCLRLCPCLLVRRRAQEH